MRILGKFCAEVQVQNVTWPRDRWSDFRKLGIKRCVRLERKKSWKGVSRSAAVARQSRISIGLYIINFSSCRNYWVAKRYVCPQYFHWGGGGGECPLPPRIDASEFHLVSTLSMTLYSWNEVVWCNVRMLSLYINFVCQFRNRPADAFMVQPRGGSRGRKRLSWTQRHPEARTKRQFPYGWDLGARLRALEDLGFQMLSHATWASFWSSLIQNLTIKTLSIKI